MQTKLIPASELIECQEFVDIGEDSNFKGQTMVCSFNGGDGAIYAYPLSTMDDHDDPFEYQADELVEITTK